MTNTTIASLPLKSNPDGFDALDVSVYYSLGGTNMFSYKTEDRGYYISVTPVKKVAYSNYKTVTSYPTDGIKKCFIKCTRQSVKREQTALQAKRSDYQDLIDYVLNKIQAKLADETT